MATKAELQKVLDEANSSRGANEQIVPEGTNKGDLEKALTDAGVDLPEGDKSDDKSGEIVLAPLVQAKVGSRIMHFYAGDTLPEGTDRDSLENLRSLGFLGKPSTDEK